MVQNTLKYILFKLDNIDKHCDVYGLTSDMRQEQIDLRAQLDRIMKTGRVEWKQRAKM